MKKLIYLLAFALTLGACKKEKVEEPKEEFSMIGTWEAKSFKFTDEEGEADGEGTYPSESTDKAYFQFTSNLKSSYVFISEEDQAFDFSNFNIPFSYIDKNSITIPMQNQQEENWNVTITFIDANNAKIKYTFPGGYIEEYVVTRVNKDLSDYEPRP